MGLGRLLAVALTGALVLPPLVGAQGLGDASKKEKQRRQAGRSTPAKTYSEEELAKLPPIANAPAEGEAAPADALNPPAIPVPSSGTPPSPAEDEAAARVRAEEEWRTRVAEARAAADRARQAHETLSGMNLVPGYEYVDDKGRTVIGSVGELQKLTATAKARRDAAEKALEDLLERARRANVPPGWLR